MNNIGTKEKIKAVIKSLAYVYKVAVKEAVLREIVAIGKVFLDLYAVTLGGLFLDGTYDFIKNSESFSLREFYISDSFWYLALMLIVWILTQICSKSDNYLNVVVRRAFYRKVDLDIIDKTSKLNFQDLENKEFQKLLYFSRQYALTEIWNLYENFSSLTQETVKIVGAIAILYGYVGIYALIPILMALPETVTEYFKHRTIAGYLDKTLRRVRMIDYLRSVFLDINFFGEIRVSGVFDKLMKKFNSIYKKQDKGNNKNSLHYNIDTAFTSIVDRVLLNGYIIFLIATAIKQKLTIGIFKAMYDYAIMSYGSAYRILSRISGIQANVLYSSMLFKLLDYQGYGDIKFGEETLSKDTPKLEFNNVDFLYPIEQIKAIENMSFSIEPGEKVAIFGKDGSGKTSLIRVLTGLYEITAGDYLVNDYSVRELARGEIKSKIAMIEQDFNKYNLTFKENITFGCKRFNSKRYKEVLEVTQLDKIKKEFNLEDDQLLGKFFSGGRDLSMGHWQRIAIARMLYSDRQINIMDEAFTFIDDTNTKIILENIINYLGEEKTLIYISRNRVFGKLFDKVYYLQNKQLLLQMEKDMKNEKK